MDLPCICFLRIDAYLRPESLIGDLGVDESLMSDDFWHTLREVRRMTSQKGLGGADLFGAAWNDLLKS